MYLFDRDKLRPFDIILFRFPDDDEIRNLCNSKYSHAVIYLGDDSFVEGIQPIVTLFSTYRYYLKDLKNVMVLRLNDEGQVQFNPQAAEQSIRELIYCEYSSRLLINIKSRFLNTDMITRYQDDKKWIGGVVCSTLVSLPYFAGGIDISNANEPYFVHFGHIENYKNFIEVTNEVIFETEDQPHKQIFDYMTTSRTGSILEEQSSEILQLNKYVKGVISELRKNRSNYDNIIRIENKDLQFSTWECILPLIARWFNTSKGKEIDEGLYQAIIKSGYNNLWIEEVHKQHDFYFPAFAIEQDVQNLESVISYRSIANSFSSYLVRMQENAIAMGNNFRECPSKSFHILYTMYSSWVNFINHTIKEYNEIANIQEEIARMNTETTDLFDSI